MLSKQRKLPLRANPDFFSKATLIRGFGCNVYVQQQEALQCSVVISKKTAPKATQRNAIKRYVYRILEQHWALFEQHKYGVVIVITREKLVKTKRFEENLLTTLTSEKI